MPEQQKKLARARKMIGGGPSKPGTIFIDEPVLLLTPEPLKTSVIQLEHMYIQVRRIIDSLTIGEGEVGKLMVQMGTFRTPNSPEEEFPAQEEHDGQISEENPPTQEEFEADLVELLFQEDQIQKAFPAYLTGRLIIPDLLDAMEEQYATVLEQLPFARINEGSSDRIARVQGYIDELAEAEATAYADPFEPMGRGISIDELATRDPLLTPETGALIDEMFRFSGDRDQLEYIAMLYLFTLSQVDIQQTASKQQVPQETINKLKTLYALFPAYIKAYTDTVLKEGFSSEPADLQWDTDSVLPVVIGMTLLRRAHKFILKDIVPTSLIALYENDFVPGLSESAIRLIAEKAFLKLSPVRDIREKRDDRGRMPYALAEQTYRAGRLRSFTADMASSAPEEEEPGSGENPLEFLLKNNKKIQKELKKKFESIPSGSDVYTIVILPTGDENRFDFALVSKHDAVIIQIDEKYQIFGPFLPPKLYSHVLYTIADYFREIFYPQEETSQQPSTPQPSRRDAPPSSAHAGAGNVGSAGTTNQQSQEVTVFVPPKPRELKRRAKRLLGLIPAEPVEEAQKQYDEKPQKTNRIIRIDPVFVDKYRLTRDEQVALIALADRKLSGPVRRTKGVKRLQNDTSVISIRRGPIRILVKKLPGNEYLIYKAGQRQGVYGRVHSID